MKAKLEARAAQMRIDTSEIRFQSLERQSKRLAPDARAARFKEFWDQINRDMETVKTHDRRRLQGQDRNEHDEPANMPTLFSAD